MISDLNPQNFGMCYLYMRQGTLQIWLIYGFWDGEIFPDYPSGPKVKIWGFKVENFSWLWSETARPWKEVWGEIWETFEDGGMGEAQAGKYKKMVLYDSLQKVTQPDDLLILVQGDLFQTSEL